MEATSKVQPTKVPYRQIRAEYDDNTITFYQAYSKKIGDAANNAQKLSASPDFSYGRMTWIKPSWSWMMYRCGYSYKDERQRSVLAIKMKHEHLITLLEHAVLTTHDNSEAKSDPEGNQDASTGEVKPIVKVQWDPERSPNLERLSYRSIQIGIPRGLSQKWVEEWIVSIEDVTKRAQDLKEMLEAHPDIALDELIEKDLHPTERPFDLPEHLRKSLEASEN